MRKLLYGCFVAFSLTCSNALAILGPGDNQPDFTLDLHGTTQPFDLYSNLSGEDLHFLDFFAEWCGPCNTASSELEPFIQQYYAGLGGNPAHIPVQVVSINTDCSSGDAVLTNAYIAKYGLPLVLDDPVGTALSYYYQGGIPQFAIIDGVAGTNYNQWGVVGTQLGYGSGLYMSFRSEINSITWAGDANGDGRVDINDLSIVLASFGKTAGMSWLTGDFTGDGKVDVNDLTIVLTNFGRPASSAGLSAVPEPSSLLLLGIGAVALLALWRKRG